MSAQAAGTGFVSWSSRQHAGLARGIAHVVVAVLVAVAIVAWLSGLAAVGRGASLAQPAPLPAPPPIVLSVASTAGS